MKWKDLNPPLRYGIVILGACIIIKLLHLFLMCLLLPLIKWVWSGIVYVWGMICSCIAGVWHFVCACLSGVWHFICGIPGFLILDIFHQDSFLATVAAISWRAIIVGLIWLVVVKMRSK